jgi:hypothetical protein
MMNNIDNNKEEWKIVNYNKKNKENEINNIYLKKKTMLCRNMINEGFCKYTKKCIYAHNIQEQYIDETRRKTYELIMGTNDLSSYTIDEKIYNDIKIMTSLCEKCCEKKCTGGMNCRNGACNKRYQVCLDDLTLKCNKIEICKKIHLSLLGFKKNYQNNDQKTECIIDKINKINKIEINEINKEKLWEKSIFKIDFKLL